MEAPKTIAFIPARGGSKSIPLKNIKPLCGKPLICWNIEALEQCRTVSEIIVATDSDKIKEVVQRAGYAKTHVYDRLAENANDTASTESVMMEYITRAGLPGNTVFMLVQATSPLTQPHHFEEGLSLLQSGKYDSILSCVRNKRFFWNEDGTPSNYDYLHRPRRQNFDGQLMENGAFYVNTVENICRDNNRLSGRIGIYEMPEYTSIEIDEPSDWAVMEQLIKQHRPVPKPSTKRIKLLLTDVDGVMTDGGMYYTERGDELKKFNTRDGMAFQLLREAGIKTGIITSEETNIVSMRARKIKADYLIQGVRKAGKLSAAEEICRKEHISIDEVAYIGDDTNCMEILSAVGTPACPSDACDEIKSIPHITILSRKGGEGCVRELADRILHPSEK